MAIQKKIDFIVLVSVTNANPNGDPLNGNLPRSDYNGFGEISPECIKRKIRNRMQNIIDEPGKVFVQSDELCDDGMRSLSERAEKTIGKGDKKTNKDEYAKKACEQWIDVRSFGQVFAFKGGDGLSVGIRGPVSIHQAISVDPVEIISMQIVKSVNSETTLGKASDTMGMRHFVKYGLYQIKGSINVQLAEKTGFSETDAELLKESLRTLFVNDASSARPDGSMVVEKLFWFKHNCKDGQYSPAKVHNSLDIHLKDGITYPKSTEDYVINLNNLEGLEVEEINGF